MGGSQRMLGGAISVAISDAHGTQKEHRATPLSPITL